MNFSSIAAVSLALLGLLAIPFMANSVTSNAISNYDEGISAVFNSSPENFSSTTARKYPGIVSEKLSPDEYSFSTSTAFGKFSMRSSANHLMMRLERAGESIEMETTSNGNVEQRWILRTPEYTLTSLKSFNMTVEKYEIPEGYCIKTLSNGGVSEECFGNVVKIDDDWQDARDRMRELANRLKEVADSVALPNPDSVQWKYS